MMFFKMTIGAFVVVHLTGFLLGPLGFVATLGQFLTAAAYGLYFARVALLAQEPKYAAMAQHPSSRF